MGCSPGICHAIMMGFMALSMLYAAQHASELQTVFRDAMAYARGQKSARDLSTWPWTKHPSLAEVGDSGKSAEVAAAQELSAAFASEGDTSWARWFGMGEASDDAMDEDAVRLLLTEAEVLQSQWRFQQAEQKLHAAFQRVSQWAPDMGKDKKPLVQRTRATHQTVEVLLTLGQFLEDRDRPAEAVVSLRLAMQLSSSMGQGKSAKATTTGSFAAKMQAEQDAEALVAQVRSEANLARVLCRAGGRQGGAVQEARGHFLSALSHKPAPPLEARIHTDFAECLHREGALAEAQLGLAAARRLLKSAGEDSDWLVTDRKALQRRLARLQAGVSHDNGAFADAVRLYGQYLETAPETQEGGLPALVEVLQRFEVMQDLSLALASLGKVDEAFSSMDDIERLQKTSGDELALKSRQHGGIFHKFLASAVEDECLQASIGRQRVVRAELVLEQSRVKQQKPPELAKHLVEEGVAFLRKNSASGEGLENALNSLGNVRMSLGEASRAEDAYRQSVKLAVMDHGEKSPLVAALDHNLASALEFTGKLPEAVKLYQKGLDIQVATLGEANPDTAGSLDSLARILTKSGRRDEAIKIAQRAVKATRAAYPEGHWLRKETEARLKKLLASVAKSKPHQIAVSAREVHRIADA